MKQARQFPRLIAEFFVIVIGVLVALGVDEFAQGREDRSSERAYLLGIAEDVRQDSVELSERAQAWSQWGDYAEQLLIGVQNGALDDHVSLFELVREAGLIAIPVSAAATYEDLIASGGLGLIRNRDLRMTISSYYALRPENVTYYERLDLRFRQVSREILPPRLAEETRGRCPLASGALTLAREVRGCPEPPGFDRSRTLERLLTYPGIEDILRSRARDLIRGSALLWGRVESATELLRLIETHSPAST